MQRTECILCDGSSVPVSRNAYKSVNEAFIRYYMEHGDMCEKRIPADHKIFRREEYGVPEALLEKQVPGGTKISILPCAAGGMIITITCRQ